MWVIGGRERDNEEVTRVALNRSNSFEFCFFRDLIGWRRGRRSRGASVLITYYGFLSFRNDEGKGQIN